MEVGKQGMIIGTHNSLTGYPLKGWCRLLWPLKWTSRCQSRTIARQHADGVRWYNLQVSNRKGRWMGSHGLFWYDVELKYVLSYLNRRALMACHKVYVELVYDNHFLHRQDRDAFLTLWEEVKFAYPNIVFRYVGIEGKQWECIYSAGTSRYMEEKYWTLTAAKKSGELWRYLPCPLFWARRDNGRYVKEAKGEFLMLDFYTIR